MQDPFGAKNITSPLIDPFRSQASNTTSTAPTLNFNPTNTGLYDVGGSYSGIDVSSGGSTFSSGGLNILTPSTTTGTASLDGGGQTGGGTDPAAAAEAQRKAEEAARIQGLRDEISARRQRANTIFDSLTAAVQNLAKEKRGELEGSYNQQQAAATDQFGQQSNLIANRYRGRGLGDSSYKTYALEDAGESYNATVQQLGRERQQGLADVGGYLTEQEARIGADRQAANYDDLTQVGLREDGTYDANALIELRSKLDERIREAEVQQAQTTTNAGFRGRLDQVSPYSGAVDTLKSSLAALARSAAPSTVKDRIAQTLIGNYAPEDGSTWTNFYQEEQKKQA